jgi:WD40 repeat protein
VWDVAQGSVVRVVRAHGGAVLAVALSPDGSLLATGSSDRTVRLWRASTGRLLAVLGGHEDRISALAFRPDGLQLASASHDDTARLWTLAPLLRDRPLRPDPTPRGNLRVCRESGEVVAVLPLPPARSVWAPSSACAPR